MPPMPDAALFAALVAKAPPSPNAAELVLDLTQEVQAVTALLREASLLLRAPSTADSAREVARLLGEAERAAQRQAEGTQALLREMGRALAVPA